MPPDLAFTRCVAICSIIPMSRTVREAKDDMNSWKDCTREIGLVREDPVEEFLDLPAGYRREMAKII